MEEVKNEKLEKTMKVLKIVMLSILIFVGVVYYGIQIWFRLPMTSYYNASTKEFVIPGLNDNFVPQGFCYDEKETQYLVSGYDSTGKASSIYVVNDEKDEEKVPTKRVALAKKNGDVFDGHAGGVAINGDFVYLANGQRIYVFSYDEIKSAQNGATVKYLGYKKIQSENEDGDAVSASFVHTYNGKLYVGEFHDGGKYKADPSHKVVTKAGDTRNALMLEYELDDSAPYGIAIAPTRVFAIPNKVQGVCVDGDTIYCSTSYGLAFSEIYRYDLSKAANEGVKAVVGYDVPLYSLDRTSHVKTYTTAPMAEELVYKDGKLYIMSEFACNKYIMGKFVEGKYCYATDLTKM
ncbi:MAG: hypothetical protein J6C23_01620 [Clostridia bacterium]|nr:hypothetical protein [Clostridia bacterium]